MLWAHCKRFRVGLHVYTMDHEVGHTSIVNFLKNQFTKPLGSSLGGNQMWTQRDGHAPKIKFAKLLNICSKDEV